MPAARCAAQLSFLLHALSFARSSSLPATPIAPAGCDTVTVYDGADDSGRVLGTFSGTDIPPPMTSTGSDMFVRFQTDTGNYGFQTEGVTDDPGFYMDWHFIDAVTLTGGGGGAFGGGGTGICPAASVLTEQHGTIHDDDVGNVDCSQPGASCGSTDNSGYGDNLNCYTTIHAPTGDQVRFTFTRESCPASSSSSFPLSFSPSRVLTAD